ncbi:MAG: anti-sigma factor antagonist [Planctomycetes bacterium]|nr:anti-sigma factor antagonist [Planctomycetota bacterium]
MKINTQNYNNVTVVELQGEFVADSVEPFHDTVNQLIALKRNGIVIDMKDITFIDSAALEQLLWLRDYCYEMKCQLKLANLGEDCSTILRITQLENEFDRYAELAEAVKSFA